jgi:hypothetical protein
VKGICLLLLPLLCAATPTETGIKTVVRLIESRYSVRHHGIPALWLAQPFLTGSGAGRLKIEEFSGLHISAVDSEWLREHIPQSLGPDWHPFVEEWSKREGEWSFIYTKSNGQHVSMLILTSDQEDGLTAVEMRVSDTKMAEWLDHPVQNAKTHK